jgi:anaphase-promoting complex subunit 11
MKVTIKKWHGLALWTWGMPNELCGICQMPFDGCAPDVSWPGDDCPVVWGKCGHAFHLPCISKWLQSNKTCPICRREWEFAGAPPKVELDDLDTGWTAAVPPPAENPPAGQ